jgi:hypothetical protein
MATGLSSYLESKRPDGSSRLIPLQRVIEQLASARASETDTETRAAQAQALAATHKALHQMYKPDETAEGRAIGLAVKDNPAADQNARSIVIHPLHRPDAPGMTPPKSVASALAAPGVGTTSPINGGEE